MAKIPDFAVRDLKLEAIARLSQEDWNYPELKHPALANVANSFRSNASIVRFMMALPTTIVNAAIETQRAWDRAELEVMGGLPGTASKSDWQKVTEKTEASLAAMVPSGIWLEFAEARLRVA